MSPRRQRTLFTRRWASRRLGAICGIVLSVVAGLLLLQTVGEGLARISYDLPYQFQHRYAADVVMVYLDANVKTRLGQPADQPLNRRFYTQLLARLTSEHARLVLFDLIFDVPSADPAIDQDFAAAIRKQSRVVLAAQEVRQTLGNTASELVVPPIPILKDAAAGVGVANVDNDMKDFTVRRLYTGSEMFPSVSWVAATLLRGEITDRANTATEPRWINYYGPPINLLSVNLDHALGSAKDGLFLNKIVIVGTRPDQAGIAGAQRDSFGTPFGMTSSGAAIHAYSLLNLLHGDWLRRLSSPAETLLVVVWGIAAGLLLMKLTPWMAVGVAFAAALALIAGAIYLQVAQHLWFSWMVPVSAQTPIALVWAVGYRYLLESRRRRRLRQAFAAYVSASTADRIANSEFELSHESKEVEATIMFTDLEGFTTLAESVSPGDLSNLLISYFDRTTQTILDQHGMVVKFIGDAVMATWGAPLPPPSPAERTVRAAWTLKQSETEALAGRRLRTRVGIHTGVVLAATLGADVPLVGDTINVAARLESLNKLLGTQILISDSTFNYLNSASFSSSSRDSSSRPAKNHQLSPPSTILVRDLGKFVVAGKTTAIGVHEVLAVSSNSDQKPLWLDTFNRARQMLIADDFVAAESLFSQVIQMRGGKDGPSEFFLNHLRELSKSTVDGPWGGIIKLQKK
jgi:adenylate cyclase